MIGAGINHSVSASVTEAAHQWHEDSDGLTLVHAQDIPKSWSDWLAEEKKQAWDRRHNTEYQRVASVPVIFIHKWLAEGKNPYTADLKEIVKWIKTEELESFLTTEKKFI